MAQLDEQLPHRGQRRVERRGRGRGGDARVVGHRGEPGDRIGPTLAQERPVEPEGVGRLLGETPPADGLAAAAVIRHMRSALALARLGVAIMLMSSLTHTEKGRPAESASTIEATK